MLLLIPIQNFLADLSPTDFQIPHFIFRYVLHVNQIHKYGISLSHSSLSQQALVFLMGLLLLPYSRPFFLQLHLHIAKPIVSYHAHYIFKIVHTNSQIIFIYSMVQRKRKYHYLCMRHFSVQNFPNEIQISNDISNCVNVHGHIHTQCTLALISSLSLFMTSTFPWCVGA